MLQHTVHLQVDISVVVPLALPFDAFEPEVEPFGNVAAAMVPNAAFNLNAVHVHFFEGLADQCPARIGNDAFSFKFRSDPVADFQFPVGFVDVLKPDQPHDFILKTNGENHLARVGCF